MVKIKIYILLFLPLFTTSTLAAQQSVSKKEVDSLLHLATLSADASKVIIYQQIAKLFEGKDDDSVFFYANLALKSAQRDKSNSSFSDAYKSLGDACAAKYDFPRALEYYLKSKEYCEKNDDKNTLIAIHSSLSSTYQNLKRFSEAIDSYKQTLEIAREIEDYQNEGLILHQIANIYLDINDYNKSLEYAIKSANILILHNIDKDLANTYNLIGYIHMSLKNNDLAQEYFEKANSLYLKANDISGLSKTLNNLGVIFNRSNENKKAIEYYSKSLFYAKQFNDNEKISNALNNIGVIYIEMGQIGKGIDYYFQSLNCSIKLYDKSSYINTINNIAAAYLASGNLQKAEEYTYVALPLAKENSDLTIIQESYQILAKIYSKKGLYNKAFEFQGLQLAYNDSLYIQQKTSSILEMQTRFETEAKEKEIQLLKKDNKISVLEVERHKSFQKYLIISSLLFLILAVVIFISLKIKRKTNTLLSQKNKQLKLANQKLVKSEHNLMELNATKDKFFSIIAHDLKNPFNALLGFSELLERNYDEYTKAEIKEYINVIYESSQSLFKLLDNLLQWSRAQTGSITYNPEQFELLQVVQQEVSYLQLNADKKKIAIKILVNKSITTYADKNIISLVIRNLVNNAIKFTNTNGRVEIRAQESSSEIEVSIMDSGIGIDNVDLDKIFQLNSSISNKGTANEEGTGLGLLLCKEFVEMNNGRIWATSIKGKGSTFYFTLPKGIKNQ